MKIGLFGIGLNTYWGQFDGLLERLQGYQRQIAEKMSGMGAEVVDAGMVDDPAKADAAARRLKENDVELVFLYISTYALSSTVLPVVQRLGVPVIVLNLQPNLITIGWTGTICTQPSMVSISVRPERYSHHLIKESGQFAINLPTEQLVRAVDWCGVKSGRDNDKFAACKLHAAPGSVLTDCPILEESPVNLECRVTQVIPLGSHDLFLAEVVACDVDESLLDENGKLCLDKAKLIVYSHGEYLSLGKKLGTFGYSVRKKRPGKRKK